MGLPLSVFDLPIFFDDSHRELGAELAGLELGDGEPSALVAKMAASGLFARVVPAAGKLDVRGLCLIRERLGALSPAADSIFAVQGLGTTPLRLTGHGDDGLLDRAASGENVFGFALTEPEAGSDVAAIKTTAKKDGAGFRLDGEKTLVSNVGIASHYCVFANANPEAGRKGITAFLVPSDAEGLTETPLEVICDHPIGALRFEGVSIDASMMIGELGGGFKLAMQTLDRFRVTVGAAAVGMARCALDSALAHVQNRVQFGAPLAKLQLVQAHLAEMVTELDAARMLVYRAAHAIDGGDVATRLVAEAKLFATEAAQRIIDTAVQLHGGGGVVSGSRVELLYRAIRPLRIYEGASDIQKLIIYRALAAEARDAENGHD